MSIDATCPVCQTLLEDFRRVDDSCDREPSIGAWAICLHCAEVLRFAAERDGALTLRPTTLAERSGSEAPDNLDDALRIVLAGLPRQRH